MSTTGSRRNVLAAALAAPVALGLGAAVPARAQEATPVSAATISTVSVSGQGMVNVPPDTAQVTVGIDVIRPDLAEAQAEASKQATDVIDAVKAVGVKAADIQTANYSVNIMRDYSEGGDPTKITGFEVMNQVLVTIRDVNNVGKLLDAVVSAGANSIYGVTFFVDDTRPFSADARKLAVEDATTRAQQLAEAAGMSLGRVISISESVGNYYPGPVYGRGGGGMGAADAAMAPPIEGGSSQITVDVQMTFEMN